MLVKQLQHPLQPKHPQVIIINVAATPAPVPNAAGSVNLFQLAAQQAQQAQNTANPAAAAPTGPNNLDFLRNSPQFQQMRQVVQAQPHLLQPLMQQLGQTNPELIQVYFAN